ncbi:unnamed protein product [Caenorhabditis nigoni]
MKTFIVLIGILASVCFQSNAIKMEFRSIANKEEYLKGINDLRRDYAKRARVPNMNELVWDDFLETRTQMGDFSGKMKTMRVSRRNGNQAAKNNTKDHMDHYTNADNRPELINKYAQYHMTGLEDLTPGHQKIGCSPADTYIGSDADGNKQTFETLCFMEPDGTGKYWLVAAGEAGTACDKGFKNDDGLCSPVQKAQSSARVGSGSGSGAGPTSGPASSENSTPITDGASYARVGSVALLLVVSMIFLK